MTEHTPQPRPWQASLFGTLAGIAAMVILAALFAAAVASTQAANQTSSLTKRLTEAADQLEALSDEQDERQAGTVKARRRLMAQNLAVMEQNRRLHQQLDALADYLRSQGIDVPTRVASPPPPPDRGQAVPPKGPDPSPAPGSPGPTAPSPASPDVTDVTCDLLPPLC